MEGILVTFIVVSESKSKAVQGVGHETLKASKGVVMSKMR